jgi:hypothetical protein
MKKLVLVVASLVFSTSSFADKCNLDDFIKKERNDNPQYEIGDITEEISSFKILGNKKRAYFYSIPSEECKTDKFVISGDKVKGLGTDGFYIKVDYVNPKTGGKTLGWIKTEQLGQIAESSGATNVKKIKGGVGSTASGIKDFDITCSNDKTYQIRYASSDDSWFSDDEEFDIKAASITEFANKFCKIKK